MATGAHDGPTIHATAVLVGARAALIRGPAGSGKSQLALRLLHAADAGLIRFARLVGDDRIYIERANGVLLARPPEALGGLIELRGLGLRRLPFEPVAAVGCVIDLAAIDAARLPEPSALTAMISGVCLPRLAVAQNVDPMLTVLTFLCEQKGSSGPAGGPT
jgi:serine kinase of HPr protein (carbohydrate metabolism regulator)